MSRLDIILWFLAGWFVASVVIGVACGTWMYRCNRREQVRGDTQFHSEVYTDAAR